MSEAESLTFSSSGGRIDVTIGSGKSSNVNISGELKVGGGKTTIKAGNSADAYADWYGYASVQPVAPTKGYSSSVASGTISGSNVLFQVTMGSSSSATVTIVKDLITV